MWLQPTVVGVIKEHWEMQWEPAQYMWYFVVIKLLYILSERDFLSSVGFNLRII